MTDMQDGNKRLCEAMDRMLKARDDARLWARIGLAVAYVALAINLAYFIFQMVRP